MMSYANALILPLNRISISDMQSSELGNIHLGENQML